MRVPDGWRDSSEEARKSARESWDIVAKRLNVPSQGLADAMPDPVIIDIRKQDLPRTALKAKIFVEWYPFKPGSDLLELVRPFTVYGAGVAEDFKVLIKPRRTVLSGHTGIYTRMTFQITVAPEPAQLYSDLWVIPVRDKVYYIHADNKHFDGKDTDDAEIRQIVYSMVIQ